MKDTLHRMDGVCFHLLLFYASPNHIATKMHKPTGQNMQSIRQERRRTFQPFMLTCRRSSQSNKQKQITKDKLCLT
jgi:hypothetical protein